MPPQTPADVALARTLTRLADTMVTHVDGVMTDVDPESLHDLRVAVRRTRSLLKLGGDVLPERFVRYYSGEFTWVGRSTGPARDLDVHLAGFTESRSAVVAGEPADLRPFLEHLRQRRRREHREVVRVLGSERFTELWRNWRADLEPVAGGFGRSERDTEPVGRFVAARVDKATERVLRRGVKIRVDSPSARIHDLRKRCKELRYLLEFARPLCVEDDYRGVLRELKRVQDRLGAFQDGEVANAFLRAAAERMQDLERPPAAALLAMGEVSAHYVLRGREIRRELPARVSRFTGADNRARLRGLLS